MEGQGRGREGRKGEGRGGRRGGRGKEGKGKVASWLLGMDAPGHVCGYSCRISANMARSCPKFSIRCLGSGVFRSISAF